MSIKQKLFGRRRSTGKIISVVFLAAFLFSNLLALIPQSAFAQTPSALPLESEYKIWRSYTLIADCVDDGYNKDMRKDNQQATMDAIFNQALDSESVGLYYADLVGLDSGVYGCTEVDDVNPALKQLGFNNIYAFFDYLGDSNLSNTQVRDKLQDRVRSLGSRLGLNTRDDFKYWISLKTFERRLDEAGCGGKISNNEQGGDYLSNESGDYYKVIDGKTTQFKFASWKTGTQEGIEGLDRIVSEVIIGQDNPSCRDISNMLKGNAGKALADAYAARVAEAPEADNPDPASGGVSGDAPPDAECLSEGSAIGWILCPIYNLVADTTQWFYNSVLQPFLATQQIDVQPGPQNPFFAAWSTFRFYGNMFLVIAMIVIVFGQSIGGGLIDAYTAKKVMPRLLAAAVMINLSIYLMAVLVDITNIMGRGISSLIMSPFGDLRFTIEGGQEITVAGFGLIGAVLGGGTTYGFVSAALSGAGLQIATMVLLVVVVPALIAIAGVAITLVIRRGLILLLLLISPVAFALYCLPNTEKYFLKWWNLLLKTLLVYPLIMAIFAIANVMSVTVMAAGASGALGQSGGVAGATVNGLAALIAFFVQLIPLFMVPFAFKFAGGAIGSLYAAIQGGGQKAGGMLKTRQDIEKKRANRLMLQARQRRYDSLGSFGDRTRVPGLRGTSRFLQNRVGGYNLHGALAEATADQFKEADAQKDTGIDDEQRALTVNKLWANRQEGSYADDAIRRGVDWQGTHMRVQKGARQYRTLGGKWVSESAVDAAHNRWDGNMPMMQWAVGYEMSKAATQEEMDYLYTNYGRLGQQGGGLGALNEGQMAGMWQGAAFAKQNTDRQYKHYGWSEDSSSPTGGQLRMNGTTLMREIDERQGNWAMMSQSADTWTTMSEEVQRARAILRGGPGGAPLPAGDPRRGDMSDEDAKEVLQRGARVARSLSGGSYRDPDTGRLVEGGLGQGASGRTKEEIENYAALFDPSKGGTDEYTREVGTTRRAMQRRSGLYTPGDSIPPGSPRPPIRNNPKSGSGDPTSGA